MVKVTQASLAETIFIENKNVSHEDFVKQMLRNFPNLPARNAALYWQNSARRARYGLPKTKLPDIYKEVSSTPKAPKVAKTKEMKLGKILAQTLGSKKSDKSSKSLDEVKSIKAKNLETIRKTSSSYSQKLIDKMGDGVEIDEKEDVKSIVPKFLHKELGLV